MTDTTPEACAAAYRELRERVTVLLRGVDPTALDATASATPEWRARDVLAHVVGVNTDIVNQNLDGVASDEWTAAQVARRRDASIDDLLDEWAEHASVVEANVAFLGKAAGQWVFDACTHEHDLRNALGVPGARDARAVAISYAWGTDRLGERLDRHGIAGLELTTDDGEKAIGAIEPRDGVRTGRFELVRAMTGRRSTTQMAAYDWKGTPRPGDLVLDIFVARSTDFLD